MALTLLWFYLSKPFKICLLAKWLSMMSEPFKTLHNFLLLHYHTFQYPLSDSFLTFQNPSVEQTWKVLKGLTILWQNALNIRGLRVGPIPQKCHHGIAHTENNPSSSISIVIVNNTLSDVSFYIFYWAQQNYPQCNVHYLKKGMFCFIWGQICSELLFKGALSSWSTGHGIGMLVLD